ncbi:MAG TPA: MFS transporter [Candidatus Limnocylindrales bacterium]|nr:MFS transporter [Candidatus Limnocylindrales bacterium]
MLPRGQLLAISVYWFGINMLWGGYEIFGQWKVESLVGVPTRGTTMGLLELGAALVAIVVQPTVGSISDYLTSRWGRRKPFIFVGGLLDLVFIIGIATSQSLLSLAAFLLLLSFSSNFAQGPFQGYVPDLVPERQVNLASALVGLMRLMGVIVGAALISTGATTGDYAVPLVLIGVIEAALALITVATVREGPQGRPRDGRSWTRIALETWGLDALRERSFVFMTLTRLLFLMGPAVFVNLSLFYVRDSLGQSGADLTTWLTLGTVALAVGTIGGTVPSAWVASRIGRKRVVWLSALAAAVGILLVSRAQAPVEAIPGLVLLGIGSGGYVAIDWALMTSTIPRVASGRYMGLANIANSISGPLALIIGGQILDQVTAGAGLEAAPRAAIMTGIIFLGAACLLLIPVRPRVEPPGDLQLAVEPAVPAAP